MAATTPVRYAWVGGDLVPAERATVSVFDRGIRSGEGVFETFRVYGRHIFRRDAHLERATAGARALGFVLSERAAVIAALTATVAANEAVLGGADSALRLLVTPGGIDPDSVFPGTPWGEPTVVVTSHPLRPLDREHREGVRAITVAGRRELPTVKALSYVASNRARRQAREAGVDEALLVRDDHVLEAAGANVFAVLGDRIVTPPVAAGILAGVTRAVAIEVAGRLGISLEERILSRAELMSADEAFLTATTREIVAVVEVDGTPLGDGRPGPLGLRMLRGYRDEVRRERASATP